MIHEDVKFVRMDVLNTQKVLCLKSFIIPYDLKSFLESIQACLSVSCLLACFCVQSTRRSVWEFWLAGFGPAMRRIENRWNRIILVTNTHMTPYFE